MIQSLLAAALIVAHEPPPAQVTRLTSVRAYLAYAASASSIWRRVHGLEDFLAAVRCDR